MAHRRPARVLDELATAVMRFLLPALSAAAGVTFVVLGFVDPVGPGDGPDWPLVVLGAACVLLAAASAWAWNRKTVRVNSYSLDATVARAKANEGERWADETDRGQEER